MTMTDVVLNNVNEHIINLCDPCVTGKPLSEVKSKFVENTLFLFPTTAAEVAKIIDGLKNTKSTGPDQVPVCLLKYCKEVLAEPLSTLINLCFQQGKYPQVLKRAYVILLHKKGDKTQVDNYRPLTLASNLSKVVEKVIVNRLLTFAEKNNIISRFQNGYLAKRSTVRACYQLIEGVLGLVGERKHVAGLFMDLSRAFDSVNHEKLLVKLQHYGVRGLALDLVKSFLTDRTQCVKACVEGEVRTSAWQTVKRGVPQGSALGPLLFVMYINDLAEAVGSMTILFADDT